MSWCAGATRFPRDGQVEISTPRRPRRVGCPERHLMDSADKVAAGKAAGSGMLAGALYLGLTLSDWVLLLTLVYFVMQIGLLLPRYWSLFKGRKDGNS